MTVAISGDSQFKQQRVPRILISLFRLFHIHLSPSLLLGGGRRCLVAEEDAQVLG
jgi:hypothetical protein